MILSKLVQAVQSQSEAPREAQSDLPRSPQGNSVDGRSARRERGRAAVLSAVLSLFDEGELRPSTEVVVTRSGISNASLFRYFASLDDLYRAAFDEQIARAEHVARIVGVDDMDLDGRIAAFVSGRIEVYASVVGVGRMARARAIDDPGIARNLDRARSRWLAQVRAVFRPELTGMSRSRAQEVAATIDAVVSFESWDLLVNARGLANSAVERHWATAVRALLA